jgi:hypothetical protein
MPGRILEGVGLLLGGVFLAFWVADFLVALVGAWASGNPIYTWVFFVVFGSLAVVLAIAATFFLVRGWLLVRETPLGK